MKRTTIILAASLAAVLSTSCETEEKLLENHVFFSVDSYKNEVRVATDEGVTELSREMSVAIASPLSQDLEVSFTASPELLDTYRQAYYDSEAELLPAKHYDLDGLKAIIKSGDVLSNSVALKFTQLGEDQGLDYSKQYVLPVTLSSDGLEVLPRSKTMYFVIKEASLVNVAADMKDNCAWPIWDGFEKVQHLETFTMEALINCHAFNNKSKIETIMGVEDHFLIRIGDVTIPTNQIQIACAYKDVEGNSTHRRDVTSAALQLRKDRWYHIAVTFDRGVIHVYLDGKLRAEGDLHVIGTNGGKDLLFTEVNFDAPHSDEMDNKPRCFWVGYSYDKDRSLDGMIAEARVWNRVLTEEEINEPGHFYKLYPNPDTGKFDESLIAYWKFDEGKGGKIKDYSVYGNDLTANHELVWYPVELPIKEK